MEVLECIQTRRSIRRFEQKPVESEKLGMILEAGRLAPSAGNLQNWRFVVVTDPALKQSLAEASFQQYWVQEAPLLIVICAQMKKIRRFYGVRGERLYAIQNCAACAQNMLLAAHSLELGGTWIGAFDEEAVAAAISAPSSARVQSILAVGYPAHTPESPPRYTLENLTFFGKYYLRVADMDQALKEYGSMIKRGMEAALEKVSNVTKKVNEKLEDESKSLFSKVKDKIKGEDEDDEDDV